MNVVVFPGQGAQFEGMGLDLENLSSSAQELLSQVDDIMGIPLLQMMKTGSAEELKSTDITQPALFVHSIAKYIHNEIPSPSAVAGHSLGEFTALVASKAISFEDGLALVKLRSSEMKKACDDVGGTMAAIIGLEDKQVEEICQNDPGVVVAANYNCPGQLVISGEIVAVHRAMEACKALGAKRALQLEVGGAFHSPLMATAAERLQEKINSIKFSTPSCPIYQNVSATAVQDVETIKSNLIDQLTKPVRWTQTMEAMKSAGLTKVTEVGGKGRILVGLFRRLDRSLEFEVI